MNKEKVIVIGRNYTSRLGMIRAVGRAGYDVIVVQTNGVSPNIDIDSYSKYVVKTVFAREPYRERLIDVLMHLYQEEGKCIIIPVDDYAASTIDESLDILKNCFYLPNVDMMAGAVNRLMDKEYQKELANSAGLNTVRGWIVDISNGEYSIPDTIHYPCFPKPQISFKGNKRCMHRCSNKEALEETIKEMVEIKPDCSLLVEEFIQIEKEYGVLGFCRNGESIIPGLVLKRMIGEGSHKGVTKIGEVTLLSEKPELYSAISRFLKLTRFTGLIDIDLYESGGEVYFNELNLRFGAFGYSILCSGVNLPKLFIDSLLHGQVDDSETLLSNSVCLSEKVNYDDFAAGKYGIVKYRQFDRMADFKFVEDNDDPQPFIMFNKLFRKNLLKNESKYIIKKLLHLR